MVSSIKAPSVNKNNYSNAQSPIVKGNFPIYEGKKELFIFKINCFLVGLLLLSLILSMISYSLVIAKESEISDLHEKITEINYENIDLQNKVDNTKSFYNINDKVVAGNNLKKADKVLEVNELLTLPSDFSSKVDKKVETKPISGF